MTEKCHKRTMQLTHFTIGERTWQVCTNMLRHARTKKVFCKFHLDRKCEHFCRDHQVLLCSYCLRDKHRDCQVADEHDFKSYYGKKIKEVKCLVETEKNELVSQTHNVISAIDAGIARLEKHKVHSSVIH